MRMLGDSKAGTAARLEILRESRHLELTIPITRTRRTRATVAARADGYHKGTKTPRHKEKTMFFVIFVSWCLRDRPSAGDYARTAFLISSITAILMSRKSVMSVISGFWRVRNPRFASPPVSRKSLIARV